MSVRIPWPPPLDPQLIFMGFSTVIIFICGVFSPDIFFYQDINSDFSIIKLLVLFGSFQDLNILYIG